MIELECLAASWGMKQSRQFLEGLPNFDLATAYRPLVPILMKQSRQFIEGLPNFDLATAYRPLVPILNDYDLHKLDNPRLLRLRLQMAR
jgi:hypothetical protein